MAQRLALIFFFTTVGLGLTLVGFWWYVHQLTLTLPVPEAPKPVATTAVPPLQKASPLLVQYRLDTPGRGEIFPALTAAAATDYWPLAILTITNTAKHAIVQVITAEIPGYSQRLQQTLVVGPQETTGLRIDPELLPGAFGLQEIAHATLHLTVTDEGGATMYAQSRPVLIHAGGDLYWGKQFANAQVVARWVTPHDPAVLDLVSHAKEFAPSGRMPGYNINARSASLLPSQVRRQAQAVFTALKKSGFSYVSSIYTFGGFAQVSQRIRLPRETLELDTANCMDISVAFASAIENLDMDPVLVIIPGHAFTGVRLGPDSSDILYLDLTVLPRGSFEEAIAAANSWLKKTPPEKVLTVDVAAARRMGIYPLPGNGTPVMKQQSMSETNPGSRTNNVPELDKPRALNEEKPQR